MYIQYKARLYISSAGQMSRNGMKWCMTDPFTGILLEKKGSKLVMYGMASSICGMYWNNCFSIIWALVSHFSVLNLNDRIEYRCNIYTRNRDGRVLYWSLFTLFVYLFLQNSEFCIFISNSVFLQNNNNNSLFVNLIWKYIKNN